jgi:hypothetical protein
MDFTNFTTLPLISASNVSWRPPISSVAFLGNNSHRRVDVVDHAAG